MTIFHTITALSFLNLGVSDHRPDLPYNPDQVHLSLQDLGDLYQAENTLQEIILKHCQAENRTLQNCIYPTSAPQAFLQKLPHMELKQVFGSALVLRRDFKRGYGENQQLHTKEAAGILLNAASNELWKRNWCYGPSKKSPQKQHFMLCSDDKDPQPFR